MLKLITKMSFELSYSVVLCVLTFAAVHIGYVENANSNCSVMGGRPEDCMVFTDCLVLKSIFENVTSVVSNVTREYLRQIHCGWSDGKIPMVCCPEDVAWNVDKSIMSANKPYSHKNLHLLTKQDCGRSTKDRIFGGSVADLYEFPWMVLLSYNHGKTRNFECGGSLITDKYVLTAAHCITNQLLGVRIGDHNIKLKLDCISFLEKNYCAPPVQDFLLEETIKHENYMRHNVSNDIALIRLKGTVDLSRTNAQPICLPIYNSLQNVQLTGQNVIVAGWGVTEKENASDVLLKVSLSVTSNDDCIEKYNTYNLLSDASLHINDNKLCAGEAGKDSCRGDSGGPLIYPGLYQNQPRYVQYGIVSYGSLLCGIGTPGVYTRITKYVDWILDNMRP